MFKLQLNPDVSRLSSLKEKTFLVFNKFLKSGPLITVLGRVGVQPIQICE